MYADLHCDTFYKCFTRGVPFSDPSLHINSNNIRGIRPYIQTFAHYIPEDTQDKLGFFKKMLENSLGIIESCPELMLFKCPADILAAERDGKVLAVLSVEGGDFFTGNREADLSVISFLEHNHIRFLSMCYNHGSEFCGGANSVPSKGFTSKGLSIASMLCEHGIFTDLSHLNHKSALELLQTDINVIATHSNSFSFCDNPRNLTDRAIELLIEKDSLIGINFYSPFLSNTHATVDDIVDHINYIRCMGGKNNIAFGADFDGCDKLPDGINSVSDIPELYPLINDPEPVFYNNVKRFLLKLK